jgi:hypothetical protein
MMRGLFAEDYARQLEWVAEASVPGRYSPPETLKARSTFWSADDVDIPPSMSVAVPTPRFAREANEANEANEADGPRASRKRPWVWMAMAVVIVGLAVAGVLALR